MKGFRAGVGKPARYNHGLVLGSALWDKLRDWLTNPTPPLKPWRIGSKHWQIACEEILTDPSHKIDPRTILYHFAHVLQQQGVMPEFRDHDAALRVRRGGSWFNAAWFCRSAYRNWGGPDDRSNDLGFRVAAVQSSSK